MRAADPDNAGAGAYAYMDLMGLVTLGWMWLRMARAAADAVASDEGKEGRRFYEAKLITARFYARARTAAFDRASKQDRGGCGSTDENAGRGVLVG